MAAIRADNEQAGTAFPAKFGLVGIFSLAGWTAHHDPEWLIATPDWPIAYLMAVSFHVWFVAVPGRPTGQLPMIAWNT